MKSLIRFGQGISAAAAMLGLVACSPNALEPNSSAPATAPENPTSTAQAPSSAIDDLADRVEDALDSDPALRQFDLDADDRNNAIVLTGVVQTAEQKALAEQIAQQIASNIPIQNQITTP